MAHVKLNLRRPPREASPQPHAPARDKAGAEAAAAASPRFTHDFSRIPVFPRAPASLQRRLAVSAPGDVYEQEAERVAERVMRTPGPPLQRACACGGGCSGCQPKRAGLTDERLQTKGTGSGEAGREATPAVVDEVLASPGQPLDREARAFFEPRFGYDFSRVRVHADADAEQSARAVNALAYTVGHNVVFGAGQYAPATQEGRLLLAHELAHVVQQGAGSTALQREVDDEESETAAPTNETAAAAAGDNAEAVPAQAGGTPTPAQQAPGAGCTETINWTPQSPVPVEITADTAVDFVSSINGALGGNPHTEIEPSFKAETDGTKIIKVNFELKTTIRRPRYGGGRASADDKALIGRIVDFIKAHEERHRDIARTLSQKAVCDALGLPAAKGQKVLSDAICKKMPTAQETLDGAEGKIELTSGNTDFKAVGVKVNYHDPSCT